MSDFNPPAGQEPDHRENPYVGPRALVEGENLFGRDRELRELLNRVIADRLVLLYSPSGAGKTSLVQAGLIPKLRREKFSVLPPLRVGDEPPVWPDGEAQPAAFNRYTYSALVYLEKTVPAGGQRSHADLLRLSFKDYLEQRPRQPDEPFSRVLIFDQFEEILTRSPLDQPGKLAFFEQVGEALLDHDLWALFVIREDFLAGLDPYLGHIPTYLRSTFRLTLLEKPAAMLAIRKPVEALKIRFHEDAASRLVEDLSRVWVQKPDGSMHEETGLVVEPVQLQVVCRRLFRELKLDQPGSRAEISLQDVTGLGDVNKALAEYYATEVGEVAAASGISERDIRDWCGEKLITETQLRGQVLMGEGSSAGLDNRAIRLLEDSHLLRAENRRNSTWFELAHDRLVRPILDDNETWAKTHLLDFQRRAAEWVRRGRPPDLMLRANDLRTAQAAAEANPANLNWKDLELLAASREILQQNRTPFQIKAQEWQDQGRPDKLLMERNEIGQAQEWLLQHPGETVAAEMEYLSASRDALQRHQEGELRREANRRLVTGFALLATLALLVAVYLAWQFNQRAGENASQRDLLAVQGTVISEERDANSTQAAATQVANATQSAQIQQSLQEIRATAEYYALMAATLDAEARISAEGRAVAEFNAALARAGSLALRSQNYFGKNLPLSALLGIEAYRAQPAYWTGRNALLTALQVNTAQQVREAFTPLQPQIRTIQAMAFSPDGKLLAWCGFDGKIKVWDLERQTLVHDLVVYPEHGVNALVFSPTDPNLLVSGTANGFLSFWDLANEQKETLEAAYKQPGGFYFRSGQILSLAMSPSGVSMAVSGINGNVVIWDVARRRGITLIDLGGVAVRKLDWSPTGGRLALAAYEFNDGVVYIWDVAANRQADRVNSDDGLVYGLDWSPDGKYIAFAGGNPDNPLYPRTISLYNTRTRQVFPITGQNENIRAVAFDQDGSILAAGGEDGNLRIWDISLVESSNTARLIAQYSDFIARPSLQGVVFSHQRPNLMAYFTEDRQIVLLEVGLANPLNTVLPPVFTSLPSEDSTLLAAGLDEDGRYFALARQDGSLDLIVPGSPPEPVMDDDGFTATAAGPLGLLALAGPPWKVSIWDTAARQEHWTQSFAGNVVGGLAFSEMGDLLAVGLCPGPVTEGKCNAAPAIQVFEYNSGQPPLELQQQDILLPFQSLAFSRSGSMLAGAAGGVIYFWNTADGLVSGAPVVASEAESVTALAYSPDDSILAVGTGEGSLLLLDTASRQQIGQTIRVGASPVTGLVFLPDGESLVTAQADGGLQEWDLDFESWVQRLCSLAGRNFKPEESLQFFPDEPVHQPCPGLAASATATPLP